MTQHMEQRPPDPADMETPESFVDGPRAIPSAFVGKLEPNYYCRGWNHRRSKYCRGRAGFRTAHPGEGRCFVHGGIQRGADRRVKHLENSLLTQDRPSLLARLVTSHGELRLLGDAELTIHVTPARGNAAEITIAAEQLPELSAALKKLRDMARRRRAKLAGA